MRTNSIISNIGMYKTLFFIYYYKAKVYTSKTCDQALKDIKKYNLFLKVFVIRLFSSLFTIKAQLQQNEVISLFELAKFLYGAQFLDILFVRIMIRLFISYINKA